MKDRRGFQFALRENIEGSLINFLRRIPSLSDYASTRGWSFIIAWCHRIAGAALSGFVLFHIYTLLSLYTPPLYDAKMKFYGFFLFRILEWALAIPVIFHALNGGRLILYESFEIRNDESMLRWVLWLSALYIVLLGILMLNDNQNVSPVFFWLMMVVAGLNLAYGVGSKLWSTRHSVFWKLQRITAAYMLILIPAHMLFMHLNYTIAHDANTVIPRMNNFLIKATDISLLIAVVFHAGYGLVSIAADYLASSTIRLGVAILVTLIMALFGWAGIKLTFVI